MESLGTGQTGDKLPAGSRMRKLKRGAAGL